MTLAVICMAFMPVGAQNKENAKQKLTPEQRIERQAENLSRRILLDDATKAKFVPLYQEYMKEMQSVCPLQNNAQKKTKAELTDKELEERMEQCFDARQKRLDDNDGKSHDYAVHKIVSEVPVHPGGNVIFRMFPGDPERIQQKFRIGFKRCC